MGKTAAKNNNLENRVLIFMPTGRDASLVSESLENADIHAKVCADSNELEETFSSGAGAILLAEEALQNGNLERLVESFNRQPIWSDIPVVLFAGNGRSAEKLLEIVETRFNATIVERPIRITMLVSAVRGALRAREKQYQTRDLLNKLEESDRQKDLFLATLSHELRTPLNSMLGWIRLLRGQSQNQIDTNHALDVIERNARAQSEMISDILFVSRVITGKLTLKRETIDLIPVIEAAIEVVSPSVEAKEIQLNTWYDSDISEIEGDSDRLRQVFLNLLSNAIKFTPPQGQINVRVTNSAGNVRIEVEDSGQGIKPEFLPYVFERFRQADSSYTRQAGGLGLGLAIVRHLVELHGGTVDVKSEGENHGATFIVKIPASTKQEFQPPSETIESSQTSEDKEFLNGIRLLLVEDNDDSREMLKVMFQQYDVDVIAVASAAEALEAIKQIKPDILISDVGLPGEDGYALIRKIRQLPPEQGGLIPAIALTGYASLQDRARAFEVGYQEHSTKPVDMDNLIELVKSLITRDKSAKQSN